MTVLGVFFTRGVSLRQWVDSGLFDREVLIYLHYLKSGCFDAVVWFTYGATDEKVANELHAQGRLPYQIQVIPMPTWVRWLGRAASLVYVFIMPILARESLQNCTVFKTNQMDGALAAVIASKLFGRPLYVRSGYALSIFVDRIHAGNPLRRGFAWLTEMIALRFCNAVSVSSHHDRDYLIRRYGISVEPTVIGNYIDVGRFLPQSDVSALERMIFVGRLSKQKNLEAGIAACASVGIGLDIVGNGPDREKLQKLAYELNADIRWLGVVPNDDLPRLLSSYRYFFIPSLWEGMPKALLEAMAAGLVCVGNNALGINEVIQDGVTGYLSTGPDVASLADALCRSMADNSAAVAIAARTFVCENFSLEAVTARERDIFISLLLGTSKWGKA